jgi:ribonuclease BN (tRNA processing enzyme)
MTTSASVQFLGTAGARHVVATQARHSGGLVWRLGGEVVWADPGPGALVRALAATPKVIPTQVGTVLLSHRHLDHSGDANAVIEAMTDGGTKQRGQLVCPEDCLGDEPCVYSYARPFLSSVRAVKATDHVALGEHLRVRFPVAHHHGVQTLGYVFEAPGLTVAHVVDSLWFDGLLQAYAGADVLVVNTTRLTGGSPRIFHLGVDDAEKLALAIQPKLMLLTHFGMQLVKAGPEKVAAQLAQRTGVDVRAAADGLVVDLAPLARA